MITPAIFRKYRFFFPSRKSRILKISELYIKQFIITSLSLSLSLSLSISNGAATKMQAGPKLQGGSDLLLLGPRLSLYAEGCLPVAGSLQQGSAGGPNTPAEERHKPVPFQGSAGAVVRTEAEGSSCASGSLSGCRNPRLSLPSFPSHPKSGRGCVWAGANRPRREADGLAARLALTCCL